MKKGLLLLLFTILPFRLLPALDIYLNGELWQRYSEETLKGFLIPGEKDSRARLEKQIPLRELAPLMTRWDALRIRIDAGEVLLEGPELSERLGNSALVLSEAGNWILRSGSDIYSNPLQIRIEGVADPVKKLTVMAEPDLAGYEQILRTWGILHKIEIEYKETDRIRDEILHRRMIGDPLPDFTFTRLNPADPFIKSQVISYQLRSIISQGEGNQIMLVLPQAERINAELFFSIMAGQFGYSWSENTLNWTAGYYNAMVNRGLFIEKTEGLQFARNRDRKYYFFPAENHHEQRGFIEALPTLPGMENPPATRIIPVVMGAYGPSPREEDLKAYLKAPGIQYSLYSPETRHLPAVKLPLLSEEETYQSLYQELEQGYILYQENYQLWEELVHNLPYLLLNTIGRHSHE